MKAPANRTSRHFANLHSMHKPHSGRRGALLLEVILSLSILFMGMAVIGIQLRTAVMAGYDNERRTQAQMLAEAKLAQLDSGAINLQRDMSSDGLLEGDFGLSFPGYFFRFSIEPHDNLVDMFQVTTQILFGPTEDDLDPGDIEDAEVLLTLHSLRPTPPTLNMQRDFGVNDEQMDELAASLPPDLDPADLSPAAFAEMDLETLLELMPQFMEIFGQGFGFSAAQVKQAFDMGLLDPANLPTGPDALLNGAGSPGGKREDGTGRPEFGGASDGGAGGRGRPRGEGNNPGGRGPRPRDDRKDPDNPSRPRPRGRP